MQDRTRRLQCTGQGKRCKHRRTEIRRYNANAYSWETAGPNASTWGAHPVAFELAAVEARLAGAGCSGG